MAFRFGQSQVTPINVAALLQRTASRPVPPTMTGGVAAAINPIATALTIRGVENRQRREMEAELARQTQARQGALAAALAAGGGRPAETVPGGALGPTFGGGIVPEGPDPNIPRGSTGPITFNERPIDRTAIARSLATSNVPEFQTAGLNLLLAGGQQADPFTLSPGETRFGPGGSPIASVPAAPREPKLSPEAILQGDFDAGRISQEAFQSGMRRLQKTGTTININENAVKLPPPPKGTVYATGGDGKPVLQTDPETGLSAPVVVPIIGGPVEAERKAAEEATEAAQEQARTQARNVLTQIDNVFNVMETADLPVTGSAGTFLAGIGGTAAADVAASLNTIKAATAFDRLQAMREASPTGGALGAVSERELGLLQNSIAALEQSQSRDQFVRNLNIVREQYLDTIHGPGNRPEGTARQSAPATDFSTMSDEDFLTTIDPTAPDADLDAIEAEMQRRGL